MKYLLIPILVILILDGCQQNQVKETGSITIKNMGANSNRANNGYAGDRYLGDPGSYQKLLKKKEENRQKMERNKTAAPEEFKKFDFENFTFKSYWEGKIKLKKGIYERHAKPGSGRFSATFGGVEYADLTGDGKSEAIVEFRESIGGGSTITISNYFIYGVNQGILEELWNFQTGSESDCSDLGLDFTHGKINFELIGDCSFKENRFENKDMTTDVSAIHSTIFTFGWNGKTFVQEQREVIELGQ